MSGYSNVGTRAVYQADDQRTVPQAELNNREPYKEGQTHSHDNLDSKDGRSIANKLKAQSNKPDPSYHHNDSYDAEAELSKKDSTLPAKLHGNEPSKGAKIDQQIQEEEEEMLRNKGKK
ncbi:hypothetical protein FE257_011637 [Aspergillus nanangensis]|uniref:Uncharacterized protein n=1 Tax=Aspergillus nanangensis TaxID=2582783 RepID=A0AAD4CUZ9_ASPNN|nr:hypothetical protein FE257_011637 [Aspergillus nanangensis]